MISEGRVSTARLGRISNDDSGAELVWRALRNLYRGSDTVRTTLDSSKTIPLNFSDHVNPSRTGAQATAEQKFTANI
jgi:hypothetical protein